MADLASIVGLGVTASSSRSRRPTSQTRLPYNWAGPWCTTRVSRWLGGRVFFAFSRPYATRRAQRADRAKGHGGLRERVRAHGSRLVPRAERERAGLLLWREGGGCGGRRFGGGGASRGGAGRGRGGADAADGAASDARDLGAVVGRRCAARAAAGGRRYLPAAGAERRTRRPPRRAPRRRLARMQRRMVELLNARLPPPPTAAGPRGSRRASTPEPAHQRDVGRGSPTARRRSRAAAARRARRRAARAAPRRRPWRCGTRTADAPGLAECRRRQRRAARRT